MKKIAITTGDPAGIGPEITAKAFQFKAINNEIAYIIYGDYDQVQNPFPVEMITQPEEAKKPGKIYHLKIASNIKKGFPSKISGNTAYNILKKTAEHLNSNKIDAVVTNPISKTEIQKTYPDFIGHTEFYAKESDTDEVIMSFWGPHFNLSLLTTHLAINKVIDYLPQETIKKKLKLIYSEAKKYIEKPKLAMLAINPHAGENGAFGSHDKILERVLLELQDENIFIDGPFPADTFFAYKATDYNMIISAFHDQGLIPFKMISMEQGVNVTLGLPFIRTSVDHGTAFDIAGEGIASEKSLIVAINQAEKMLGFSTNNIGIYSLFAEYYDKYMQNVDYDEWVNLILNKFDQYCYDRPKKVLELASGTCNVSSRLVMNGIECHASDISSSMLKLANQKPFSPQLYQANMLSPIKNENYDLVILLFDSINYLQSETDIATLLDNVYEVLEQNGLFIFDISTIKNCNTNFSNYKKIRYKDGESFIHIAKYFPMKMLEKHKLLFYKKKGFQYEHIEENHKQKIYHVSTLKKLIKKSKLKLIEISSINNFEDLKLENNNHLDRSYTRLFFTLKKV